MRGRGRAATGIALRSEARPDASLSQQGLALSVEAFSRNGREVMAKSAKGNVSERFALAMSSDLAEHEH